MARPAHPDTLFHLVPQNGTAEAVLHHQDNAPFISASSTGKPALEVGYHVSSRPRGGRVVARLGRDADLMLPAKNISRVHVAFEVHPVSRAILFCVCAERMHSVKVTPGGFRDDGDFRQLALEPGIKYDIHIGASARFFHFKTEWWQDAPSIRRVVDAGFQAAQARAVNPRWLKTEEDDDSELRSWYNTRLPSGVNVSVRAALQGQKLGSGAFGNVFKATDMDSGHVIAVKVVEPETDKERSNVHREVRTMQTLNHPHIIEFLGQQGWAANVAEIAIVRIFMPLRTGSVCGLAPLPQETEQAVIHQLSYQMLCALDYLSSRNLCHRDVKPPNILYDVSDGNYTFQLADFGLANREKNAGTNCGTRTFSAPELHAGHGLDVYRQSPKMDVWSLMVTIVSLMAGARFDGTTLSNGSYSGILAFVRNTVPRIIPGIMPMARENPELRASAAQMLALHFGGNGLTTRPSEVGHIPPEVPAPEESPPVYGSNAPAPPVPGPSTGWQKAPQAPAFGPNYVPPAGPKPSPPPVAGPSEWDGEVVPTVWPRRWDATSRVTKVRTPRARERERRSRFAAHFGPEDPCR